MACDPVPGAVFTAEAQREGMRGTKPVTITSSIQEQDEAVMGPALDQSSAASSGLVVAADCVGGLKRRGGVEVVVEPPRAKAISRPLTLSKSQ